MMHSQEIIDEMEKNKLAYDAVKGTMEAENWGKTVLLHDGEVIAVYNDKQDAYSIACEKYGLGNFSLQRVGQRPIALGFLGLDLEAAK